MDKQHKIEKSIFNPGSLTILNKGKTYIERYEEKYSAVAKVINKKEVVPFRNSDSVFINTNNLY